MPVHGARPELAAVVGSTQPSRSVPKARIPVWFRRPGCGAGSRHVPIRPPRVGMARRCVRPGERGRRGGRPEGRSRDSGRQAAIRSANASWHDALMSRPVSSSEAASTRMRANRRRDTRPELALRSELHRRGRRFRVDAPVLPGLRRRADLVFRSAQIAVFVDGCYWHGCPIHGTASKSNAEYWKVKIAENRARDSDTDRRLIASGWLPLRIWEHEDVAVAADRVEAALRDRHGHPGGSPTGSGRSSA
jgi:DNA mismatch endonuclease (patch repair protein)